MTPFSCFKRRSRFGEAAEIVDGRDDDVGESLSAV
jgi:hypothetical protein